VIIEKILICVIAASSVNAILGTVYRYNRLSEQSYRILSVIVNVISAWAGQILMGIPYNSPFAVILALVGGLSLGIQVANVIIRIGRLEARQRQKASTEE
jgi:predicted RND superfamily exporter protein